MPTKHSIFSEASVSHQVIVMVSLFVLSASHHRLLKLASLIKKLLFFSHVLDGGRNHTCLWCLKKQRCISDHKFLINHLRILFQFLTSHWWMIVHLLTLVWTWIFFVGGPQGDLSGRVSVGLGIIPFWGFGAVSKNTQLLLTSAWAEEYFSEGHHNPIKKAITTELLKRFACLQSK